MDPEFVTGWLQSWHFVKIMLEPLFWLLAVRALWRLGSKPRSDASAAEPHN